MKPVNQTKIQEQELADAQKNQAPAAQGPQTQSVQLNTLQDVQAALNNILFNAVKNGASDVHLKVGAPPCQRVNGKLTHMEGYGMLTPDILKSFTVIIPPKIRQEFLASGDADYAYSVPSVGRFRVNSFMQRGTPGFVFRTIPKLSFTLEGIGLPKVVKNIATEKRGLVLVTGTTGSGKSTTLAGMVDYINSEYSANIITLEDPIEFLHNDKKSLVAQREVGVDTSTFSQGLRRALRQDPDVILVGEMRDLETIETALHAAETGHLVLSTLHTLDATETVNRIISMFPPHQQQQIRIQLAGVLRAIISQRLVPRKDKKGRVPAVEVMINTAAIKDCILDGNRTGTIEDFIKQGRNVYHSQTFDQSLYELVKSGMVAEEEALNWVKRKDDFKMMLKGISGSDSWDPTTS